MGGGCSLGVRGKIGKGRLFLRFLSFLSLSGFFFFRGHYDEKEDCGLYVRSKCVCNASFMLLKDV
jgi:hypothetical protein